MRSNNIFNQILTMLFRPKAREKVRQHSGIPNYPFIKVRKN